MNYFETIGGEQSLRTIISEFVDRCYADAMIGFLFARADRERIKTFEYQHAARFLGAEIEYGGRALDDVHRPHRILGGQFDRRRQILKETLDDHEVHEEIRDAWLMHQDGLRPLITRDPDSNCQD